MRVCNSICNWLESVPVSICVLFNEEGERCEVKAAYIWQQRPVGRIVHAEVDEGVEDRRQPVRISLRFVPSR